MHVEAVVKTIEFDPNRSANIALVHYTDGLKHIIAPKGLEVGQPYRFRSMMRISKIGETLFHLQTSQLEQVSTTLSFNQVRVLNLSVPLVLLAQVLGHRL